LAVKDLDEMSRLIKDKIKESRKDSGDKTIPLKDALQAVFSRPNNDFLIEKILPPLKAELEDRGGWDHSVRSLVKEAVGALQNPKAFKPEAQVTYIVFLENIVAEFKPRVADAFESSVLKQIADAKIEVTKEAQNERKLRMMRESQSPSVEAKAVIEAPPPAATVPPPLDGVKTPTPATSN
jgi:hypothetical protein